jgi:dynein heavy chain 2
MEVMENVSRFDRILTAPGGSLLLCGRSGVGRRTALAICSSMNNIKIFSPKIHRTYSVKQFKNDLKTVILLLFFRFSTFYLFISMIVNAQVLHQAGIEGNQIILLLEDHQFVDSSFLELTNSLLSAGEIPGLYNPEELEPLLSAIREDYSQENFKGTILQYFAKSIKPAFFAVH